MTAIGVSLCDRLGDRRHELGVERVDGDGDRAAAGEADVEAVLVVETVVDEFAGEPFSTSFASRITAGSTQPPVTPPAISRGDETASAAPGSRGAEPIRSTTEPSATAEPSPVHRWRVAMMSFMPWPDSC